jgi:hypothetical protein
MTHRQALREIHSLGFSIHATTSFEDGISYEARRDRVLARGEKAPTADLAMAACYRAVLGKASANAW